jgi:hypothetical protein
MKISLDTNAYTKLRLVNGDNLLNDAICACSERLICWTHDYLTIYPSGPNKTEK